ncbi:hypothetical protein CFP56_043624 [Quercus suber]|uniref:Secreted protein n=1 Tax=Quercus suber TaxID=58331 RepID=A0AAW0LHP5_QUESU
MFSKNCIWIVPILLGMTEKIKYTRWLKFASFPSRFRPQLLSWSLLLLDGDNVIDTTQKNNSVQQNEQICFGTIYNAEEMAVTSSVVRQL